MAFTVIRSTILSISAWEIFSISLIFPLVGEEIEMMSANFVANVNIEGAPIDNDDVSANESSNFAKIRLLCVFVPWTQKSKHFNDYWKLEGGLAHN